MATYEYGASASANQRPDLAPVAGRYAEVITADGVGGVGWGSLAVAGTLENGVSGQLSYDDSTMRFIPTGQTTEGLRPIGMVDPPSAARAGFTDYNLNQIERGLGSWWDTADPKIRRMSARDGDAAVEMLFTKRSTNHCLQLLDQRLFGTDGLGAASSPFTATDHDVDSDGVGTAWSDNSADIVGAFESALINYEAVTGAIDLDTCTVSARTKLYMAQNTALRAAASATATTGPMSNSMLLGALEAFGIRRLVVVPTSRPVTDTVFLTRYGNGNPIDDFVSAVFAWGELGGYSTDQNGFSVQVYQKGNASRIWEAYTSHFSDVAIPAEGGVRIIDVY